MAREDLKTRKNLYSTIDKDLDQRLRLLSKNTGVPISKLLDRSVKLLLESDFAKRNMND